MDNAASIAALSLVSGGEGGLKGAFPRFFLISFVGSFSASECAKIAASLATGGLPCAYEIFCGVTFPFSLSLAFLFRGHSLNKCPTLWHRLQ